MQTNIQLTGIGKAIGVEKEKLVGSLMFRKKGHLTMPWSNGEDSSFKSLKKNSILV